MEASLIAYSRQKSLMNRMDVVANNIANVSTSGFKEDLSVFLKPQGSSPVPKMMMALNESQGALKSTGRQFDVAIKGIGYFQVESPLGPRYTRSGAFLVNSDGALVTKEGYTVSSDSGSISLQPGDNEIKIGDNGEVYAVNGTGMELRGSIGVFKFADPSGMQKVGDTYFKSDSEPEKANAGDDYRMAQGMLEDSNVNSVEQMAEMIEVSRDVQSVAKIISDQHTLMKSAVQRLSNTN